MRIDLPADVKFILDSLSARGHSAYCVGGCVRDALLGKAPVDWDIATSALPDQVKEVFPSFKVVGTGIKHGTVTVIIGQVPYEITTFRVDGSYSDNRHPDSVSFSGNIRDDLSRRDFTVNAMAYNENGLVDCFGGAADTAAGIIRCVGDGERRFTEDALRIMRALRFSSALGFKIEPRTRECLLAKKELLKNIAVERITAELLKLICGKDFGKIFAEYSEVIFTAIPSLGEFYSKCEDHAVLLERNLAAAAILPGEQIKRMAVLVSFPEEELYPEPLDIKGRSMLCEAVLRSMRLSNKFIGEACRLAGYRSVDIADETAMKLCAGRLGYKEFFNLMQIKTADAEIREDRENMLRLADMAALARELQGKGACLRVGDLKVSGESLAKKFGLQGPEIGDCLEKLLLAVLDEKVANTARELTKYAEKALGYTLIV